MGTIRAGLLREALSAMRSAIHGVWTFIGASGVVVFGVFLAFYFWAGLLNVFLNASISTYTYLIVASAFLLISINGAYLYVLYGLRNLPSKIAERASTRLPRKYYLICCIVYFALVVVLLFMAVTRKEFAPLVLGAVCLVFSWGAVRALKRT